ncbi:MAG: hypothetical protein RL558_569, partial [Bacteroidota bacterium]
MDGTVPARILGLLSVVLVLPIYAQTARITGTVTDAKTREAVPSAVVTLGSSKAVTDSDGKFVVQGLRLPTTIAVEAFGFNTYRGEVRNSDPLSIKLNASSVELAEAQIVASKISEKQKQAPLTVEALDLASMKEAPAPNFYEALGSMKGVDLTSASIGFKIINTRGFNSTSPVRSLQVIDGVDNQAPGLNFSLGNFLGASELDVQQVDVISGAVGALYGPSAFNGVIAMTTKDPYRFQGTSVQFKGGERRLAEFGFRHAEAFKRADGSASWAYKINLFALRADDWEATNMNPTDDSKSTIDNPGGYDAVNRYGDELTYDHGGDVK